MAEHSVTTASRSRVSGLAALQSNAIAGFLVFLIAMPLCLAIARASGFPPIAGIWTAVIGGIVCSLLSNSELTIKGPAAGLIVIVAGAVTQLGAQFGPDLSDSDRALLGYKLALGIGVASGLLQIVFSLIRAGKLADFFPLTPVHGLLASIGIIIVAKQIYEVFGIAATPRAGPIQLLMEFPQKFTQLNPEIATIGVLGLITLFGMSMLGGKFPMLRRIPAQLVVLVFAVGLDIFFDLEHPHSYTSPFGLLGFDTNVTYEVGPQFLVRIPDVVAAPLSAFALPDFRGLFTTTGLQYLVLFSIIGSLESLLSAKAIDLIDPWRRKTNFDRDMLAIGVANTASAMVGGLPMISEIVRSKANIDNGAVSRWSNFIHGTCLLVFVLACTSLIRMIPLAALGAMLVFTGYRLANPREFIRCWQIGPEQLVVFVTTIVVTLATDLLIGMAAGIVLEVVFHLWNGASFTGMWKTNADVAATDETSAQVAVRGPAVFSNWLGVRAKIQTAARNAERVEVNLTDAVLIDHTVMEKLHELEREFTECGKTLFVAGTEAHIPLSAHPLAARKKKRDAAEPEEVMTRDSA